MRSIEQITSLYNSCIELLKQIKDTSIEPLYFEDKMVVKTTPHIELYRCYGCGFTDEYLMLFDGEKWAEILPQQANAEYVLQTLFQRLTTIKNATRQSNAATN